MRLIDADTLKKCLKNEYKIIPPVEENRDFFYHNSGVNAAITGVELLIDKLPTAYDIEKVLQRLEEEINEKICTLTYEQDIYTDGYKDGLRTAIELAKGGKE